MSYSGQIPRIEDCDPDDPDQALLPFAMNIPVAGRSPMVFPRMIGEFISRHFIECGLVYAPSLARLANEHGFIHVDDLPKPTKKYVRPYRGPQHVLNNGGGWGPVDTPEEPPIVIQDPVQMTAHEQAAQLERYRYLGYKIDEPEPEPPKAQVVRPHELPPRFDPSSHAVTEVNAYLRGSDDELERRRVIHAETTSKARAGILKRWGH